MFHEDRLSSKERGGQGRLLSQCDGGSQRETSIFCGDIPVFKTGTGEDLAGQKISWPEDAQKGENSTGALDFLQGQRIPQAEIEIANTTTVGEDPVPKFCQLIENEEAQAQTEGKNHVNIQLIVPEHV